MMQIDTAHEARPVATAMSSSHQSELVLVDIQSQGGSQKNEIPVDFASNLVSLGGGKFLHLWEKPRTFLDIAKWQFKVEGWDISVEVANAGEIPREMGRTFMKLWRKSQHQLLTEQDEALWASLVDQVDVARFSRDQENPRYMEAQLLEAGAKPMIRLHDGSQARLRTEDSSQLVLINKGEWFSAYIKLDARGEVISFDKPVLIGTLPSEEETERWPPLASA
jgi:hypothetical protein